MFPFFSSKTTIKEVNARPKLSKSDRTALRVASPSPTRARGHFEMSTADDRLTRKTAINLSKAKLTLEREERRPRSTRRQSSK